VSSRPKPSQSRRWSRSSSATRTAGRSRGARTTTRPYGSDTNDDPYHFTDRAGLLRHALEFVNARAAGYTEEAIGEDADPRERLELMLLLELGDDALVQENSSAWGELRASAVFEPELREPLRAVTDSWNQDVADAIERAQLDGRARTDIDPLAAAERLTSLIEGLSCRWLSGTLSTERARALLREALALELDRSPARPDPASAS
jgi:AcrR family transcriptional regulator